MSKDGLRSQIASIRIRIVNYQTAAKAIRSRKKTSSASYSLAIKNASTASAKVSARSAKLAAMRAFDNELDNNRRMIEQARSQIVQLRAQIAAIK